MKRRTWTPIASAMVIVVVGLWVGTARAGVVLSTDFTGRTVSGPIAQNITWTTDGVSDPGDLTTDAPDGLFDTANAQGHFAPDRNVGNEGPWSVDIPFVLTASEVSITSIVLDWQDFSNSGDFQAGGPYGKIYTATISDSSSTVLATESVTTPLATSGSDTITFSSPVVLDDSDTYTLNLHATNNGGSGNNTGFDAVTVNGTVTGAGGEGGPAVPTAGFDFLVDASLDTDGDAWGEDLSGSGIGLELLLDDSPAVNRVAAVTTKTTFSHAYDLPGGSIDNEAGLLLVDSGSTTMQSFQESSLGDLSQQDVTLEIWFKPNNLTPTPSKGQILFEDGGGTGLGIFIVNNQLLVSHDGNEAQISYNLSTDPSGVLLAAATTEFIQAVVTYDTGSPYLCQLFVNGVLVGTSNDSDNDWSGGDAAGFGTRGDDNVGGYGNGQQNTESFDGQIALVRFYAGQILLDTEVEANFDAYVISEGGYVPPVSGYYFEWDAAANPGPGTTWPGTTINTYDWTYEAGSQTATDVTDPRFDLITKAYLFPGAKDAQNADWTGHGDNQPATFEFVLDVDGDDGVIFESGGSGDGIMIDVAGGAVRGMIEEDPTDVVTSYALTATDKSRFIHVIFVADNANNVAQLYVDGELKDTQPWTAGEDWSGTDDGGLGAKYGSVVDGGSTTDLTGKIALFRYYRDKAFTADEVARNFDALGSDSDGPVLISTLPTNNATGVSPAALLIVTFDEEIVTNAGNVVITNLSDGTAIAIPMGNSQISVSGTELTVDPTSDLAFPKTYAVLIDGAAIEDAYGNSFSGITDTASWTFETVSDTTGPVIFSTDPANNATDVLCTNNLVATFDEGIIANTGNVILTNLTDATAITIPIGDAQISIDANTLTINPSSDLDGGDTYAVKIGAGAVKDAFGNLCDGITDTTTWRFETDPPPVIDTLDPVNGAINVLATENFEATFSEEIELVDGGIITFTNLTDGTSTSITLPAPAQVSAAGAVLTIDPGFYPDFGDTYAILINGASVRDLGGNSFAGITNDTTWRFTVTTEDTSEYIGPNTTNNDRWNLTGSWDTGVVPQGPMNAVIPAGKIACAWSAGTPTYTGDLIISNNATVRIGWTADYAADLNALGTPGSTTITMYEGAHINVREGSSGNVPAIVLRGSVTFSLGQSTQTAFDPTFGHGISGPFSFTLLGKGGGDAYFTVANSFSEFAVSPSDGSGYDVFANAAGSMGAGNVTIPADGSGNVTANLIINVADAMGDTVRLSISGPNSATKLTMNANDTIHQLWLDGVQQDGGTYTSADGWISGGGTLTVVDWPASVTNNGALNVTISSADLVGTLDAINETFDVYVYWGTNDNVNASAWLSDGTSSNMLIGTFSDEVVVTGSVSSLSELTAYYYTMVASNALEGRVWASPNASFTTPGAPTSPTVTTGGGATNIDIGTATLRGLMTAGGSGGAFICYGATDGGTSSTGDWANVVNVSAVIESLPFSTDVSGLFYGIEYDYRVYVTNSAGSDWSELATFTTKLPKGGTIGVLSVDFSQGTDTPLQTGFQGFSFDDANPHTLTYASDVAADGTIDVTVEGQTHYRDYAAISGGDFVGLSDLLSDSALRNSYGTMTLTLSDLVSGSYEVTTYHHGTEYGCGDFVLTLTDADVTDQEKFNGIGTEGTSPAEIRTLTFPIVSNGNDVQIKMTGGVVGGGNPHIKLNGFELRAFSEAFAITNTGARNILAESVDLVAELDATQSVFTVTAYWSENDNAGSAAWLADGSASSQVVGTFTNVTDHTVTLSVASLTVSTTYYYTMVASNAVTNIWATPNATFDTLIPAVPPTAGLAGGATNIGSRTATLRGVLSVAAAAQAYICWGESDGGTTSTSGWDNVIDMGVVNAGNVFSNDLSGLYYGIEYNYRVYVTNSAGGDWSALDSFTTLSLPTGPVDIATTYGRDGTSGHVQYPDVGAFGISQWHVKNSGDTGSTTRKGYVRFDVSDVSTTVTNATLDLVVSLIDAAIADNDQEVHVYGLTDEPLDGWVPGTTTWANAPGNNTSSAYLADLAKANDLGSFFLDYNGDKATPVGTVVSFSTQALVDFINGDSNGLVTFILGRTGNNDQLNLLFAGDTHGTYAPPVLTIQAEGMRIANTAATNIAATTATLRGTLDATQSVFTVTAYWSTNDNADGAAWLADGSASSSVVGTFTNVHGYTVSKSVLGLTSGSTYYYTLRASNAATNMWATPNTLFGTLAPPVVTTDGGAANLVGTTATLRGLLTGGGVGNATIVWGDDEPALADDTNNWDFSAHIGPVSQGVVFSTNVSGLALDTTYYYRCYVTNTADEAWSSVTNFSTPKLTAIYAGPSDNNDNWNGSGNWDVGIVPAGAMNAVIPAGVQATANNNSTPAYNGDLTINNNATVQCGWTGSNTGSYNALGTPGSSTIYAHSGAYFNFRPGGAPSIPAIQLLGNASMTMSSSTQPVADPTFGQGINGPYTFALGGKSGCDAHLTTSNNFAELTTAYNASYWAGGFTIHAEAAYSLPSVVTIEANASDVVTGTLYIDAANAMPDDGVLTLNGSASTTRLVMNAHDTIYQLWFDGVQQPGGTYTSAESWMTGGGTLTVSDWPVSITNDSAVNVVTDAANLVGTLDAPNETFDVWVYWSTNDNADSAAWLADGVASNMLVGVYSNVVAVTGAVSSLLPTTIYYYTMVASNALEGTIWASPNATFVTPGAAAPPTVTTDGGATNISIGTATLRGLLTVGGAADAVVCWGASDGGTGSTGDWDHVSSVISAIESIGFSTNVAGLYYGIEYAYRVYVTNGVSDAWSDVATFTTLPPAGGGGDTPVAGAYYEWDAAEDLDGNNLWPSTTANSYDWTFDAGSQTPVDVSDTRFDRLTKAYAFPGAKDSSALDFETAISDAATKEPATFELVLDADTDDGVIFESGGTGDGLIIDMSGGAIRGLIEEDSPDTLTSYTLTATDKSRFVHVVFVADNVNNVGQLYVDGELKSTDAWSLGEDWSGTDDGGLGAMFGAVVEGGATAEFAGKIALFRYYRNTVFDIADVTQNFNALSNGERTVGITNTAAANILAESADLVAELDATQSVFTVTAYWSENNNADSAAWLADGSASSQVVGTFTNVTDHTVTLPVASLTASTTYYYTMVASNAVTNIWAIPNATFDTLTPAVPPTAGLAGGATNSGIETATLRGVLTVAAAANAYFCWGDEDGGTSSTGGWDKVVSMGVVNTDNIFSNNLSGLLFGIEYDYRVYVTNGAGGDWSALDSFTTLVPRGQTIDIATTDGTDGASGQLDYDDGGSFGIAQWHVKNSGATSGYTRKGYVRFDVSGLNATVTNATLKLTQSNIDSTIGDDDQEIHVYGITNQTLDDWSTSGMTWANAPANDASSAYAANLAEADELGSLLVDFNGDHAAPNGTVVEFSEQALIDFVAADSNGQVTFILGRTGVGASKNLMFAGETHATYDPPVLSVETGAEKVGVANTAAGNVQETSADLEGTLEGTGSVFTVTVYWSESNNVDSAAWLADGTKSSALVGTFTNVIGYGLSESVSTLTGGATYYYAYRASNASTNMWASPTASFTTLSDPAVDNDGGATDVVGTTATLNGLLTAGANATAYIVWGDDEPAVADDTNNWDFVLPIGSVSQGAGFSTSISGLGLEQTYYYRCYVTNAVSDAWSSVTNFRTPKLTATYIGPSDSSHDKWNLTGSWDIGIVPAGSMNAVIPEGKLACAWSAATPTYNGDLTIGTNATVQIGWTTVYPDSYNALGTPGSTTIHMYPGAYIYPRMGQSPVMPAIQLHGNARMSLRSSTYAGCNPHFDHGIHGPYTWTLSGKAGATAYLAVSNSFDGLIARATDNSGFNLQANAVGALGVGDVTIEAYSGNDQVAANLIVNAADAMADTATLRISGPASVTKLTMNADDTVAALVVDGITQPIGTYGRIGLGSVDFEVSWIGGDGVLTVPPPPSGYWDLNGDTAGAGGPSPAGTWDAVTANWNADAAGTGSAKTWTAGEPALFAAGADATGDYTVAVSGTHEIGGLTFEEGTVTLIGGALSLTSDSIFNVAPGRAATVSSTITNDATARQLTKSGDGNLVLGGTNRYEDVTRIEGGTLSVSSLADAGNASGIGSYPSAGRGGLVFAGGEFEYSGGTVSIDRGFTVSGGTTIDISTPGTALTMGDSASAGVGSTVNVTGGAGSTLALGEVTLIQGADLTLAPGVSGLTVASARGYTSYGTATPTLTLGGTSAGNVVSGSIYRENPPGSAFDSVNMNLVKSGPGGWTVLGSVNTRTAPVTVNNGTLTLSGASTYSGATTINGGALLVNGSVANSVITVKNGGTFGGTGTVSKAVNVESGGTIGPGDATGTLTVNNNVVFGAGGVLAIEIGGGATPELDKLAVSGGLLITDGTLDLTMAAPMPSAPYVIATYGVLTGTFGTTNGLPAGAGIDYGYDGGTAIAVMPPPTLFIVK